MMLDVVAGGGLIKYKALEEAMKLIENMASSDSGAQHDRPPSTHRGLMELSSQDAILAQVKALKVLMANLPQQLIKASSQLHHVLNFYLWAIVIIVIHE